MNRKLAGFFDKPYRWAILYGLILSCAFAYVLLDAFVIPRSQQSVMPPSAAPEVEPEEKEQESSALQEPEADLPQEPVITGSSYQDENIQISIEALRVHSTTVYVADIRLSDSAYLKTALAKDTFGRNIKEKTSEAAEAHNAIFAVNGDYYGFRDTGYVLRNGTLYRDQKQKTGDAEDLVIDGDGNLRVIAESQVDAQALLEEGAQQVFSFGPALVLDGEVVVGQGDEVSQSKSSNPRTAIGQVDTLHYIVIVSDGRTDESEGLSLLQLAQEFAGRGCTVAYNLDGGGSSTMYFMGEVVNNPSNGRRHEEREVSDIVYIG